MFGVKELCKPDRMNLRQEDSLPVPHVGISLVPQSYLQLRAVEDRNTLGLGPFQCCRGWVIARAEDEQVCRHCRDPFKPAALAAATSSAFSELEKPVKQIFSASSATSLCGSVVSTESLAADSDIVAIFSSDIPPFFRARGLFSDGIFNLVLCIFPFKRLTGKTITSPVATACGAKVAHGNAHCTQAPIMPHT